MAQRRGPITASQREAYAQRLSLLCFALAKHADAKADRDRVLPGEHRIEATIRGTVDGQPLEIGLAGRLAINHDSERSSSTAAPPAEVLALAVAYMPKKAREEFFAALPEYFEQHLRLPPADAEIISRCEKMLKALRYRQNQVVRGSVRFDPDPEPAKAAKAAA